MSRKLIYQIYYHYRIKEYLIYSINKLILIIIISQIILNIIYIFWDLLLNYSLYSLLPLFYFILQVPMFNLDFEKRYESATKEMIRSIKSKIKKTKKSGDIFIIRSMLLRNIFAGIFFDEK